MHDILTRRNALPPIGKLSQPTNEKASPEVAGLRVRVWCTEARDVASATMRAVSLTYFLLTEHLTSGDKPQTFKCLTDKDFQLRGQP